MARGRKPHSTVDSVISGPVEQLPIRFEKNKINFNLIKRNDKAAMYHLTDSDGHTYYEIFHIKVQPAFSLWSKPTKTKPAQEYKYEPKEKYPNDEAFGQWAWTFNTRDVAMEQFNNISK